MPKVAFGDQYIYYEVHGAGAPVLLVPGLGGVGSYWNPNLRSLAKDYQVVIHDHRGTGQSSRPEMKYSVDQMADDLLCVMDHLNIEAAHLVGHSTGGAIGQTIAVRYPERLKSLVVYASWTKANPYFSRVFEARRALLNAPDPSAYVRSSSVFLYPHWWVNQNSCVLEERERLAVPMFPSIEIAKSRIDAIVSFDRTADLPAISVPTLVVCAKDDILTPPHFSRELAQLIPRAELAEFDQGGHCLSETFPREFESAVMNFIARHAT
jgi:aminoacrylate hydrolase